MAEETPVFKLHPIQTNSMSVRELHIIAHRPPDVEVSGDAATFSLSSGHSPYDEKNHTVNVVVKLEGGFEEGTESPFGLKVEIIGEFQVNEELFPKDQILSWAARNAPLIMMPYLREQVYALTARCGFRPMLMPLFEVPTLRVGKKPE